MLWKRIVLSLALSLLACAAAQATPTLTLLQKTPPAGTAPTPCEVKVAIMVNPGGATITASAFTIRYKVSQMTIANIATDVTAGTDAPAGTIDAFVDDGTAFPVCDTQVSPVCTSCATTYDRHVTVLFTPNNGLSYTGTSDKEIAVVKFTGVLGATSVKVEWDAGVPAGNVPTWVRAGSSDLLGSPALNFVPATSTGACNGLALTVPGPNIVGAVKYYGNNNGIPNVNLCVNPPVPPPNVCGVSVSTTGNYFVAGAPASGTTTFTSTKNTEAADPRSIGGGDVNLLIAQIALGTQTISADQKKAGDVTESGGVDPNSADLNAMRRYLVFDFANSANCGKWRFNCDATNPQSTTPCNLTMPGTCTNVTQNVKGFFLGDIDDSWPNRFKASGGASIPLAFGNITWDGLVFSVPVVADVTIHALSSMIFSLSYDTGAFEYLDAEPGYQARRFDLAKNPAEAGVVHGLLTGGAELVSTSGEIVTLRFRLRSASARGNISFTRLLINDEDASFVPEVTVSRDGQTEALPKHFQMTAIPNPFNPSTLVEYTIPDASGSVPVSLRILDLSGRLVRNLVAAQQGPGRYRSAWDGSNDNGERVASGVYLLQLRAGTLTTTQKAVLLK